MADHCDFRGKVVLITGAGSGIGAVTAALFHKLGATLSLTDINEVGLNKTLQACLTEGRGQPKPLLIVGDLGKDDFRIEFIEKSVEKFGQVDVLYNNAGIAPLDPFETTSLEMLDKVMNINFRAPYHLTILATPHLKKTKGNIVNMSSCASTITNTDLFSYSISKGAVDRLTKITAAAVGGDGIRVNSVNPGAIQTELYKQFLGDISIEQLSETFSTKSAIPRLGQPIEVARVVVFLASENASFVTGINMMIDAGLAVKSN